MSWRIRRRRPGTSAGSHRTIRRRENRRPTFELSDGPGETIALEVDWGDGTLLEDEAAPARSVVAKHAYAWPGDFDVTLVATDASGLRRERQFVVRVAFP